MYHIPITYKQISCTYIYANTYELYKDAVPLSTYWFPTEPSKSLFKSLIFSTLQLCAMVYHIVKYLTIYYVHCTYVYILSRFLQSCDNVSLLFPKCKRVISSFEMQHFLCKFLAKTGVNNNMHKVHCAGLS